VTNGGGQGGIRLPCAADVVGGRDAEADGGGQGRIASSVAVTVLAGCVACNVGCPGEASASSGVWGFLGGVCTVDSELSASGGSGRGVVGGAGLKSTGNSRTKARLMYDIPQ
jgi:hypothetical protein